MNNKAFVFTGMSFLLVIPAVILAASYLNMVSYGEEARVTALESDKVYYMSLDLKETIVHSAQDSGRYNAYLATKNVTATFERLANERSVDYAVEHSWFTDPELTTDDSRRVIEDNVRGSINDALADILSNYPMVVVVNNGDNITNAVISLDQIDPWGFYVNITELPLLIQHGRATYNTTIPAIEVYVSIEGLQDPYIFVKTRGRSSNKIIRTNYTPIETRYDESKSGNRLYQLYNVLIGSGKVGDPKPFYHAHNASGAQGGICFFDRLDGKDASDCTHDDAKMETFIVGDPLAKSGACIVDHHYFTDAPGSTIQVSGSPMEVPSASPNNYEFRIDSDHLTYYGLNWTY